MGAGYDVIDQAMHGQFVWQLLLALVFLKTPRHHPSRFPAELPGACLLPTLFIGAMLGGAVGAFEKHFFPALTGTSEPIRWSAWGFFSLDSCAFRSPPSSWCLRSAGTIPLFFPSFLANTIAFLLSRSLQPVGIFEIFTHQDGLDLPSMEEQREESVAAHRRRAAARGCAHRAPAATRCRLSPRALPKLMPRASSFAWPTAPGMP